MVTVENLKKARNKEEKGENEKNRKLQIGDLVLVKDVNSGVFHPKYSLNFRIVALYGNNPIAVKGPAGKIQVRRRGHIKIVDPVDKVWHNYPAEKITKSSEGRQSY